MPYHYAEHGELPDVIRAIEADGETVVNVIADTTNTRPVSFHIFTTAGRPPMTVRPSMAPNVYRAGGAA